MIPQTTQTHITHKLANLLSRDLTNPPKTNLNKQQTESQHQTLYFIFRSRKQGLKVTYIRERWDSPPTKSSLERCLKQFPAIKVEQVVFICSRHVGPPSCFAVSDAISEFTGVSL